MNPATTTVLVLAALAALALPALFAAEVLRGLTRNRAQRRRTRAATPIRVRVAHHERLNDRLCRMKLVAERSGRLPLARAGQYVTVCKPADADGLAGRRRYSLAAHDHVRRLYELCVKREDGGQVSEYLYDRVRSGDLLEILPPGGEFVLRTPRRRPLVLIAGGVGITPMRAMLQCRLRQRAADPTWLFFGARRQSDLAWHREFQQLARRHKRFHYHAALTRPEPAWTGQVGRISAAAIARALGPQRLQQADFYLCAAQHMTDALVTDLEALGVKRRRIHFELFAVAAGDVEERRFSVEIGPDKRLESSNRQTLLQAFEAAGIGIDAECRAGDCGHCRVRVESGRVRWLIDPPPGWPADQALTCCCAPESDLSLRLPARA